MTNPSIAEVIEASAPPNWWSSLKGCDAALGAVRQAKMRWNNAAMSRTIRAEVRRDIVALMEQARTAEREIVDRKRVLSQQEDYSGAAFDRALRRLCRQEIGDERYRAIVVEAEAEAQRITAVRDAPMPTGSVLAPRGAGGMKQRRVER